MRPSPATGAMASSTSAISSSLAPAASARPVLHSRHTRGAPMATHAPTCSNAAVLTSRADVVAGSSASPASLGISPSDHAASAPCELSVLSLVVVLELVQDNMGHSVAGLDHQVLIGG